MTDKLTIAQHKARAALLGRWYGENSHTYINNMCNSALDADTLEPVTPLNLRMRREIGYGYDRTQR